jgi:hypothetical protein
MNVQFFFIHQPKSFSIKLIDVFTCFMLSEVCI